MENEQTNDPALSLSSSDCCCCCCLLICCLALVSPAKASKQGRLLRALARSPHARPSLPREEESDDGFCKSDDTFLIEKFKKFKKVQKVQKVRKVQKTLLSISCFVPAKARAREEEDDDVDDEGMEWMDGRRQQQRLVGERVQTLTRHYKCGGGGGRGGVYRGNFCA
jgi:hypothetical protein